jgi:phage-related protein
MAKTRKNGRTRGILSYLYNPIDQIIKAANNVTRATTNTVGKVVHTTANGVNRVGKSVTGRANTIVSGLVPNSIRRRFTMKKRHPKRRRQ